MNTQETISWIFLATALASKSDSADFNSISAIADGINHAVPTHKELQTSMTWLTHNRLVVKTGNKYKLTPKGESVYVEASHNTPILLKIIANLSNVLKKYNARDNEHF